MAIDPSVRSTGVAIFQLEPKTAHLTVLETVEKTAPTFQGVYTATKRQAASLEACIKAWGTPEAVIQEFAPHHLCFSPGLYMVGGILYYLLSACLGIPTVLVASNRIPNLVGIRKIKKSDTKEVVNDLCKRNSITVLEGEKQVNLLRAKSDKTDALLLLLYLVHNYGCELDLGQDLDPHQWLLKESFNG